MKIGSALLSVGIHAAAGMALFFAVAQPESDMVGSIAITVVTRHISDIHSEEYRESIPEVEVFEFILEPVLPEPEELEPESLEGLGESLEQIPFERFDIPLDIVSKRLRRDPPLVAQALPGTTPAPRISPPAPARGASPKRPKVRLRPIQMSHRYPDMARRAGVEGIVRIQIVITPDGRVAGARIVSSSGHAILDSAALISARQWRFYPPGETRRVNVPLTYRLI